MLLLLIISEFLTFAVIQIHLKGHSRTRYYLAMLFNTVLSIYLWALYIELNSFRGLYDDQFHIWLKMSFNGALCAIFIPRIILIGFHFAGMLIKIKEGGHIRKLTDAGFVLWFIIFGVVVYGSAYGRFDVRTEEVTIHKESLHPDLEGFTIALISDLHLAGFYNHQKFLKKQMEVINSYSPDIVVNSGDFVSYGWRESNGMDTILAVAYGRLGNYAVFGNHDMGTYLPAADYTERESNILMIRDFIHKAGYQLLTDNNVIIRKGEASVSIAGITTRGRHGHIKYGNLSKALEGTENADFRILISHDPNHWRKEVAGKTGVDLTLAGHTHGMQVGIFTKKFRWSPSKYFYPEWGGLYHEGGQWLYVNRGLGVLGIPFRIWMPPEITIIRLTGNLQQKAISSF
ncbi:MAG TPA: metallophosphoesterase [Bacteroidales bacterium]|nr:metallophosphoesterase [Bacteroidales bacterium]